MAKCRGGNGWRRWRQGSRKPIAPRIATLSPPWATRRSGTNSWAREASGGRLARLDLCRLCCGRPPLQILAVQTDKIDRIEHQGREPAVAHRSGDDFAREREQQPRTFDHDQRVQVFL